MKKNIKSENAFNMQNHLILLVFVNCVALVAGVFISSYRNINLLEKFIFRTNDGWCYKSDGVIGLHCFGDFGVIANVLSVNSDAVWTSPIANYPPVLLLFSKLIIVPVINILSYKLSALLFFALEIILIMYPIKIIQIDGNKGKSRKEIKFLILIIVTTSLPFIITLDRGNLIALAVPLLFVYLSEYQKLSVPKSNLLFIILASLKPQFMILLILDLRKRQYKRLIEKLFIYVGLNTIALIALSKKSILINASNIIESYSNYSSSNPGFYPYNYSFAQTIKVITTIFGLPLNLNVAWTISIGITCISLFIILCNNKTESDIFVKLALIILSFMSIKLSYAYYSIVIIPLLYLMIEKFSTQSETNVELRNKYGKKFFVIISLLIVPIYLPGNLLSPVFSGLNLIQLLHPIIWSYFLIFLLLIQIIIAKRGPRNNF